MRPDHAEQIERWAEFVRTHPRSVWIKQLKPFIDSQIIKANDFYRRLAAEPGGAERVREIRAARLARIEERHRRLNV